MVMFFLFAKQMVILLLQLLCKNLGDIFPINVSALDKHTTKLKGTNLIIVHDCTNSTISLVRVYVCMAVTCLKVY